MKTLKILFVLTITSISISSFAQRGVFVHESYNSIRKFIHPLKLSHAQVRDWSAVERFYDYEMEAVRINRRLPNRVKSRKLNRLFEEKDLEIRSILSRRQYDKFRHIKRHFSTHHNGRNRNDNCRDPRYHGTNNQQGNYYNGYDRNEPRRDRNNDYRRQASNSSCAASTVYGSGNYYGTW